MTSATEQARKIAESKLGVLKEVAGAEDSPKDKLWELCQKFIKDNEISCAESIAQMDHVIENAYDFLTDMCDIIGYHEYED